MIIIELDDEFYNKLWDRHISNPVLIPYWNNVTGEFDPIVREKQNEELSKWFIHWSSLWIDKNALIQGKKKAFTIKELEKWCKEHIKKK